MKNHAVAAVFAMTVLCLAALASPPSTVNVQGVLRDSAGAPLSGPYDMTFRLYDDPAGGNEILVDAHMASGTGAVTTTKGLFNAALGGGDVSDGAGPGSYTGLEAVFADYGDLWLEFTIQGETLAPRQKIHSVPFALNASDSKKLGGAAAADYALKTDVMPLVLSGDGTGSTLDADLLDGLDSSAFSGTAHDHDARYLRKDVADTAAGDITFSGEIGVGAAPLWYAGLNTQFVNGIGTSTAGAVVNSQNSSGSSGLAIRGMDVTSNVAASGSSNMSIGMDVRATGPADGTGLRYGISAAAYGGTGDHYGVRGIANDSTGSGTHYGVLGSAFGGATNYGVYGTGSGGATNWGLYTPDDSYTGGNLAVGGSASVNGNATFNANVTFGNATSDTLTFTARANSSLLPSATNTYNLGASANRWNYLYANNVDMTGTLDLGAGANDDLTASDVTDLTDGGQTALHTHAAADATTLDGIDSANFLRSDVADTANGTITFASDADVRGSIRNNGGPNTVYVSGGLSVTGSNSSNVILNAGDASAGVGGAVSMLAGTGSNAVGGNVAITSGTTSSWSGAGAASYSWFRGGRMESSNSYAEVEAQGGKAVSGGSATSDGGNLTLRGGDAAGTNRSGGNVVLEPGSATGSGTPGIASVVGSMSVTGNTTLGDASSDTVTVNGTMGVGAAPATWASIRSDLSVNTTTAVAGIYSNAANSTTSAAVTMRGAEIVANATGASNSTTVFGLQATATGAASSTGDHYGIQGDAVTATSGAGDHYGVRGRAFYGDVNYGGYFTAADTDTSGWVYGGYGTASANGASNTMNAYGLFGSAVGVGTSAGNLYGVYGQANTGDSATHYGVYGTALGGAVNWGLYTPDDAYVGGTFTMADAGIIWANGVPATLTIDGNTLDLYLGGSGADEIYFYGTAYPQASAVQDLGSSGQYWDNVYADAYFGKSTSITAFDVYPDLDLLEAMQMTPHTDPDTGRTQNIFTNLPPMILGDPVVDGEGAEQFVDYGKAIGFAYGSLRQMRAELRERERGLREELNLRTPDPETGEQAMDGNMQIVLGRDGLGAERFSVFGKGQNGIEQELLRLDENGDLYVKGAVRPTALDLAEYHPVAEAVEPGDVLVMGPEGSEAFARCRAAADRSVVGIVSEAPGLLMGSGLARIAAMEPVLAAEIEDARSRGDHQGEDVAWKKLQKKFEASHAPLALSGTVLCKVDAGYAPVRKGDLLVASPTPGHAMRDDNPAPGTIVGKALESLDSGAGLIRVLVMLR